MHRMLRSKSQGGQSYKLIDSAQATVWYHEEAVGRVIRSSNIPREQLFLVSELHPRHLGYEVTKQQFNTSLRNLGTLSLDLFLLHYPRCFSAICNDIKRAGLWRESWKALEELYDELKTRAIGVSSFNKEELQELVSLARVKPAVVQRNSDNLESLVEFAAGTRSLSAGRNSIYGLQHAWELVADERGYPSNPLWPFDGSAHHFCWRFSIILLFKALLFAQVCTSAQVVLSWVLEKRQVLVPRSNNQFRIIENLDALYCNFNRLQVTSISALNGHVPRLH